jgi:CheY-like chemotaxis protein
LGLAISRSLVRLMGGEVEVSSQLGHGSTFSFHVQLHTLVDPPLCAQALAPTWAGKTLLLVDDNASSRHVLSRQLQVLGLHTVAVDGAAQALHSPQLRQSRCALIDVNMPDIDGFALAAQLRQHFSKMQMSIVMMGALSEQISQEHLESQGIQGFLVKPIDVQELADVLNGLTGTLAVEPLVQVPEPEMPFKSQRVLLVEDMAINQTLETILLQRMGYEVRVAKNGIEAIEAFSTDQFDLILMDIHMPEMGGVEAAEIIRMLERNQQLGHTPIIAVTANALIGDKERYLATGMDGYVSKPIAVDALRQEIKNVMHGHAPMTRAA